MATLFDDRERAFEAKWALEADHLLRIRARRNRYLAEWAAERRQLSGPKATHYIRTLVRLDFDPKGEAALITRVAEDLDAAHGEIRDKLAEFEARARDDLEPE